MVNDLSSQVDKLISNPEKMSDMLRLEKARRGVDENSLLFIGIANLANYYWCSMQAVLRSRAEELMFFNSYIADRLNYSGYLGMIEKIPRGKKALLETGGEISLKHIEMLLSIREKQHQEQDAKGELNLPVNVFVDDPKLLGKILQVTKAEKYPTIRWNFEWRPYVVLGVPDGITADFVYEFKTTGSMYLLSFAKPVAHAQADLYGYFFRRDKKRVQIYVKDKAITETWHEQINVTDAESVLKGFLEVDNGHIPEAPISWKCKRCEFNSSCKII